jgi:hypothetical protein
MSDVIQFAKRKPKESPEIVEFKSDLKLFIKWLEKINPALSTQCSVARNDNTTNTIIYSTVSMFTTHLIDYCKEVMDTTYSSFVLVNPGLVHTVDRWLEWSETMSSPLFDFQFSTNRLSLSVNAIMLNEDTVIVPVYSTEGIHIQGRIVSHLSSVVGANAQFGNTLCGGDARHLAIDGFDWSPTHYGYTFNPEDTRNVEFLISDGMDHKSFLDYLADCLDSSNYLQVPIETNFLVFNHPKFTKSIVVNPWTGLYLPGLIPLDQLDKLLTITAVTDTAHFYLQYSYKEKCYIDKVRCKRNETEVAYSAAIKKAIVSHDLSTAMWEGEGDALVYRIPVEFKGHRSYIKFGRSAVSLDSQITTELESPLPITSVGLLDEHLEYERLSTSSLDQWFFIYMLDESTEAIRKIIDALPELGEID